MQVVFNNVKESIYQEIDEGIDDLENECKDKHTDLSKILSKMGSAVIHSFKCKQ